MKSKLDFSFGAPLAGGAFVCSCDVDAAAAVTVQQL